MPWITLLRVTFDVAAVGPVTAHPPRIPLVFAVVVLIVPAVGLMKSTKPPVCGVIAPRFRFAVPPAPLLTAMTDGPCASVVLEKV